jgi:hypothetical protein
VSLVDDYDEELVWGQYCLAMDSLNRILLTLLLLEAEPPSPCHHIFCPFQTQPAVQKSSAGFAATLHCSMVGRTHSVRVRSRLRCRHKGRTSATPWCREARKSPRLSTRLAGWSTHWRSTVKGTKPDLMIDHPPPTTRTASAET